MKQVSGCYGTFAGSLRQGVTVAIAVGILAFLGRTIVAGWEELQANELHPNFGLVALSLGLLVGNTLQQSLILRVVLKKLGYSLPYKHIFRMLSLATLSSYLPGRLWSYASLAYLGKEHALPALSSGVGIMTTVGASSIAGAALSLLVGYTYLDCRLIIPVLLLVPLLLLVLHPAVLGRVLRCLPKRWQTASTVMPLPFTDVLSIVIWESFSWALQGLHLSTLVLSICPLPVKSFVSVIGIAPAAWLIGYYSLITPGGLGVREGAAALLLSTYMPFPLAAAIALFSQIATMTVQMLFALIALRIR